MGLTVKPMKANQRGEDGEVFELCPKGSYPAVLVAMIDLGYQERKKYDRPSEVEWSRRLYLAWEVQVKPRGEEMTRYYLCNDYTLSLAESANLRKILEAGGVKVIEDQDNDVFAALGKPYLLKIAQGQSKASGKDYAKIDGVTELPEAMAGMVEAPDMAPRTWEMSFGEGVPDTSGLPWLFGRPVEDVIKNSREWREWSKGAPPADQQKQQAPAQQAAPASTPPPAKTGPVTPPPRPKTTTAVAEVRQGRTFWVEKSEAQEPVQMTELALCDWLKAGNLDARTVRVCLLGTETWLTADHFGIAPGVPF